MPVLFKAQHDKAGFIKLEDPDKYKLCLVIDGTAYFSDDKNPYGQGWDQPEYVHHAHPPFDRGGEITVIALKFSTTLWTPAENGQSGKSVDFINKTRYPWLQNVVVSERNPALYITSGATIREFIEAVQSTGGTVYWPLEK
jgi:hypothetical protein